ncbi:hypothetical protein K2173_005626 [Erythroxylum novogranatense]|uniref:Uncharacterized protein n=1 Tax=Erythroxylum novogranatense TaxID=1862640 RepID=A0AAV8SQE2_9ROSI|nr:hypothetical protein K2173_005626 [Erythroxylum novogranatense]
MCRFGKGGRTVGVGCVVPTDAEKGLGVNNLAVISDDKTGFAEGKRIDWVPCERVGHAECDEAVGVGKGMHTGDDAVVGVGRGIDVGCKEIVGVGEGLKEEDTTSMEEGDDAIFESETDEMDSTSSEEKGEKDNKHYSISDRTTQLTTSKSLICIVAPKGSDEKVWLFEKIPMETETGIEVKGLEETNPP